MEENKTAKKHIEENRIQTYNQRNAKLNTGFFIH